MSEGLAHALLRTKFLVARFLRVDDLKVILWYKVIYLPPSCTA